MARKQKKVSDDMAKTYAEAVVVNGLKPREAARVAGYSENTKIAEIERKGGPAELKIRAALEAHGIDETSLAKEYAEGLRRSKEDGAKDRDHNAHAKYLLQLGYLLGHGRSAPSVAVQINQGAAVSDDPDGLKGLLGLIAERLEAVETEICRRDVPGVHDRDAGPSDAAAHDGVVEAAEGEPESGDSGLA